MTALTNERRRKERKLKKMEKKTIEREETPGEEVLFAIYDVKSGDHDGELRIEIAKDLDEKKAIHSFLALFAAIMAHDEMRHCFQKAVNIFTSGGLKEMLLKKEDMMS
jgi:hypothetical protein